MAKFNKATSVLFIFYYVFYHPLIRQPLFCGLFPSGGCIDNQFFEAQLFSGFELFGFY